MQALHRGRTLFAGQPLRRHLARGRPGQRQVGQRQSPDPGHRADIELVAAQVERPYIIARQALLLAGHAQAPVRHQADAGIAGRHREQARLQHGQPRHEMALQRLRPRRTRPLALAPFAHAVLCADVKMAGRQRQDAADDRLGRSGSRIGAAQHAAAPAVQPGRGADPEILIADLLDVVDALVAQCLQRRRRHVAAVLEDRHATARAHPQSLPAIEKQFVRRRVGQIAARDQGSHVLPVEHLHVRIGAEHDRPVRGAQHAPHQRIAHAVGQRHAPGPAIPDPVQAAGVGAQPEIAVAILQHGLHPRAPAQVQFHLLQPAIGQAAIERVRGADPQRAAAIGEQALDRPGVEPVAQPRGNPLPVHDAQKTGGSAQPQLAVLARQLVHHALLPGGRAGLDAGGRLAFDAPAHLAKAAAPEFIVDPQQAEHRRAVAVGRSDGAVAHALQALGGGEQRRAVAGVDDRVDGSPAQCGEAAVVLADHSAITAEPHAAARIGPHRAEHAGIDAAAGAVVADEAGAVETGHGRLRVDPQKTVAILGHAKDGDLRQPLLHAPVVEHVGMERLARIHGARSRRDREAAGQHRQEHEQYPQSTLPCRACPHPASANPDPAHGRSCLPGWARTSVRQAAAWILKAAPQAHPAHRRRRSPAHR